MPPLPHIADAARRQYAGAAAFFVAPLLQRSGHKSAQEAREARAAIESARLTRPTGKGRVKTWAELTAQGKAAYKDHVAALKALIAG